MGTFIHSQRDPLGAVRASGGRSRRTRSREATRGALVTAADSLFDEVGYSAARTSDIARRADVAQATLFRYFDTKADLAVFRLRRGLEELVDAVRRQPPSQGPHAAVLAAAGSPGVVEAMNGPAALVERARVLEHPELAAHLCWVADGLKQPLAEDLAARLEVEPAAALPRALSSAVMDASLDALRSPRQVGSAEDPNRLAIAVAELRPLFVAARTPP